ncbi:MAG: 3'-5' exonuclease, partial [Patescibacteria group bacterium]
AQYLLISLLAQKYRNLCVIGDPDQSIYGFRGADIRNILEFRKEYPNALSVKLERNYRSTQPILDCADAVIAVNPNRPQKKMWTHRADGEKAIVHDVADEKREAAEAVKLVLEALARGTPLREQVVLYRTNAQSRLFEEACMRASLPYRLVGGVKFYARREVKDVLAYLHAIYNPANSLALLRIINVPSRKIGKTTVEALLAFSEREKCTFWDSLLRVQEISDLAEPVKGRLTAFAKLLLSLTQQRTRVTVATLTRDLLAATGMEQWIKDGTSEGEERWENIGELLSVMGKYDGLEPALSLTSFLEEVALVSEVDKLTEGGNDALTLMTLHLCKGLEFQHVLIAGCEEGILPHSSALFDHKQLEEERRLLYVGMTRAKDILRLLTARSRMLWGNLQGNAPSRFLDDLPPERTEWKSDDMMSPLFWKGKKQGVVPKTKHGAPDIEFNQDTLAEDISQERIEGLTQGARIAHPAFGSGTITARRGDIVDIAFDSGTKKKFALSIAPLTIVS